MDVDIAIALVLGLLMGAAIMGVFMGTVAHDNFNKYRDATALAFDFEEKWLDALEGNTDRMWMLKAEGAEDPYVVRGRPDIAEKRSSQVSEDGEVVDTIDLTWAD